MKNKSIALTAIYLALSLMVGSIETLIPPIMPILPYFRLGLSNLIILFAMLTVGALPTLIVVIGKSTIVPLFFSNPIMIIYSLCASLSAYLITLILVRIKKMSLISISLISSVVHNFVQICVAAIMTSSSTVFFYLPILALFGSMSGILIGFLTMLAVKKIPQHIIF